MKCTLCAHTAQFKLLFSLFYLYSLFILSFQHTLSTAASAFLNMPPPRTRQNNLPVTPSVPPAGQSAGPESDQKSGTETQAQRRPSSMFVRRSVVESLFGNDEPESGNNAINDSNGGNGGNNVEDGGEKSGEEKATGTNSRENTDSGEDAALAAATAAATLYNTSLNTHPGTNSSTTSHAASNNAAQATAPVGGAQHVFNTRSSSDDSVYNHIVRSVPSLEGENGNQVRKERGLSIPVKTEETAAGIAIGVEAETTEDSVLDGVPVAATTVGDSDNVESSVAQDEETSTHTVKSTVNAEVVHTTNTANTSSTTESAIHSPNPASTLTSAPHTIAHDHASIHTIQPPGPNKNPAKFVAPTYVQHPVSYLKVGKGTVNISTSVSATANISAGKGKSGPNSYVSSSSGIHSSNTHNVLSSDRETSETSGATNAEKAKAMVGVGSVKDRIKKFETLKSDSTDNRLVYTCKQLEATLF